MSLVKITVKLDKLLPEPPSMTREAEIIDGYIVLTINLQDGPSLIIVLVLIPELNWNILIVFLGSGTESTARK